MNITLKDLKHKEEIDNLKGVISGLESLLSETYKEKLELQLEIKKLKDNKGE